MSKMLIFLFLLVFFTLNNACALDWRNLNEQADKIDLNTAVSKAQENPGSIEDNYVLGVVYFNLYQDRQAGLVFDNILTMDPNSIEGKWGRAEALRRFHDFEESQKLLKEVLNANPGFAPASISLAYIKYILLDFEEASRLVNRVIALGDKVDITNMVRAYSMSAGIKGTIAYYGGPLAKILVGTAILPLLRKAEKLQPDAPGVLFGLGSFYLLVPGFLGGDINLAQQYLEKAVNADPYFADAYVRLAQVYKQNGNEDKYKEYLDKALQIDSRNELALDVKNGRCKYVCP